MEANYLLELHSDDFHKLLALLPSHSDTHHPLARLEKILSAAAQTEKESGYCLDVTVTIVVVKE